MLALLKLIRNFKLYPPNHPNIQSILDETWKSKEELFAEVENLKVALMGGVMFLGNTPLENPTQAVKNLIRMLSNIKIKSFEMNRAMSKEDLANFANLCGLDREEILLDEGKGDFNEEKLKEFPMQHIKVNEIEIKIGDEPAEGEMVVDEALAALAEGVEQTGKKVSVSEDQIMAMIDAILSRTQAAPGGGRRGFEEIGDMLAAQCSDIKDLKKNLFSAVARMTPEAQKDIFGETFTDEEAIEEDKLLLNLSIRNRANIIRNQLKQEGIDPRKLKEDLGEILNEESEVVELAEIIAREFDLTTTDKEKKAKYISKLSALVQSGLMTSTEVEPVARARDRGTVLIAEDDEEAASLYQRFLHSAGFETVVCNDGQETLKGIRSHQPDMIVLDMKLPGLHGLDIIYFLRKHKEYRVPVIIYTAFAEFQNEFEIKSYPKVEYLLKPVKKKTFLDAVDKLMPPPKKEETPQTKEGEEEEKTAEQIQMEEDMQKARGVQAKLLPEYLPDIPGYDVGTFYCSCKDVGGDYFDIIEIDDNHTGFLVADVSGKGVSGAMVMVMVRSILKLVAPHNLSPKQTLVETNALIAKDMKLGMFVTGLYFILNHRERTLNFCCAGHNPALIWRQNKQQCEYMQPSGMAMGITTSSVFENSLKEELVTLDKLDRVCTYTDGVVEAMSPEYEEFGEDRLAEVVKKHTHRSSEELIDEIYAAIQAFEDTAPRHDDITIVTLKVL